MKNIKPAFLILFLMPSLALSSEVVLRSGQMLEGKITDQTDKYIKIDTGIGMSVTFFDDEIDTIDGQKIKVSPSPVKITPPVTESVQPVPSETNPEVTAEKAGGDNGIQANNTAPTKNETPDQILDEADARLDYYYFKIPTVKNNPDEYKRLAGEFKTEVQSFMDRMNTVMKDVHDSDEIDRVKARIKEIKEKYKTLSSNQ